MIDLAKALERHSQDRPTLTVDIREIVKDADIQGSFKVRALTMDESFEATEVAVKLRKKLIAEIPEQHAKQFYEDPSFFDDLRQVERLHWACRNADDVSKPAFPDASWMRKTFTANEMSIIAEWYGRAERAAAKVQEPFTEDQRLSLAQGCGMVHGTEFADRLLAGLPRHVVAEQCTWVSQKLIEKTAEVERLTAELEALKAA